MKKIIDSILEIPAIQRMLRDRDVFGLYLGVFSSVIFMVCLYFIYPETGHHSSLLIKIWALTWGIGLMDVIILGTTLHSPLRWGWICIGLGVLTAALGLLLFFGDAVITWAKQNSEDAVATGVALFLTFGLFAPIYRRFSRESREWERKFYDPEAFKYRSK